MNRIRFAHHRHWTMRRNLWAVVVHRRRRHWLESDHDDSLDLCLFHKILSTFLSYMISRFTFFVCVMVIWGIYAFSLYKFFQWEISLVLIFTPFPWVPPWSGVKEEFLFRHRRKNHPSCSKAQNLDYSCFMSGTNIHQRLSFENHQNQNIMTNDDDNDYDDKNDDNLLKKSSASRRWWESSCPRLKKAQNLDLEFHLCWNPVEMIILFVILFILTRVKD